MSAPRRWRAISGEALRAFVRGKTVDDIEDGACESTTTFTDGSAARCSAVDGVQYSTLSGDSATVTWEVSDAS